MKVLGLISATVIAGLAAACGAGEVSVGAATVTASSSVSYNQAVDKITTERCNRELSCDNVGPNRYWEDMGACRRDVRRETRDYLEAQSCGGSVDAFGLATCVDSIRNARCSDENVGTPRLMECRAARLCP